MPFTLPQLSRREFLRRAALAGAVAAASPSAYAGLFGKSRDKHTVVFFSDPHIAADPRTVFRDVNMADNLSAVVKELLAWPDKPEAVIVNGDLAKTVGLAGDYATFGKLFEPVRALAPVHLTVGNHDERAHFWRAFPQDAKKLKSVPEKQVAVFPTARAHWFLLDSLDITNSTPGLLGTAQLEWLDRELTKHSAKPAIIVAHHSPDVTGMMGLKDTADLEELFLKHRQVKAFIFGHTHVWSVARQENGIHLINLPPTGYVFEKGRPSGWVRFTLTEEGMDVELRSLDPQYPDHGQVKKLRWRSA